jgi:hypothetical protein
LIPGAKDKPAVARPVRPETCLKQTKQKGQSGEIGVVHTLSRLVA